MKQTEGAICTMKNTCVAFGRFDGLHAGHRATVQALVKTAAAKGLAPVLVSFDCDAKTDRQILTTEEEKRYLLCEYPLKAIVSVPLLEVDEAFVRDVIVGKLGAKAVVTAENHQNLALLQGTGGELGLDVIRCDVVEDDGRPIDSQRVAQALAAGQMDTVQRLLGHSHFVMGEVVTGKQLGRTVGQPTANINFSQNKLLPPDGSYVTVTVLNGERRVGLTNIGKRPTVDNFDYKTVENHIMDFSGNLYGEVLVVEFLRFIRGVEKFGSLAEVKAQIDKDVQSIRAYIESVG